MDEIKETRARKTKHEAKRQYGEKQKRERPKYRTGIRWSEPKRQNNKRYLEDE